MRLAKALRQADVVARAHTHTKKNCPYDDERRRIPGEESFKPALPTTVFWQLRPQGRWSRARAEAYIAPVRYSSMAIIMFSSVRSTFSRMYFPVVVLVAIILTGLDANTAAVVRQVRTVTVTVYVTMVHTVPVYVPVTAFVTIASMATSFIMITTTAVSVSLGTVTLWNTITSVTSAVGMLGLMPGVIFGQYSDVAVLSTGAVAGAVFTLLFAKLIPKPAPEQASSKVLQNQAMEELQAIAETTTSNTPGTGTGDERTRRSARAKIDGDTGQEGAEEEEGDEESEDS